MSLDQAISDVRFSTLYAYTALPANVILYYDYCLTLSREVEYVWKRGVTRVSVLFFLNRYPSLFFEIYYYVSTFTSAGAGDTACARSNLADQVLLIFNQVVVTIILGLRTSALYQNTKKIIIFLLTSGFALLGFSCWAMSYRTGYRTVHSPFIRGCMVALEDKTAVYISVPWVALAIADIIVFCLTVYHTARSRRFDRRRTFGRADILTDLIFRDGAIYFLTMIAVNVANILMFFLAEPLMKSSLTSLASRISVTMVSRLMLNLYESAQRNALTETSDMQLQTTVSMILGTRIEVDTMAPSREMGGRLRRSQAIATVSDDSIVADTRRRPGGGTLELDEREAEERIEMLPRA